MADYYCQFSVELPLSQEKHLASVEIDWLIKAHSIDPLHDIDGEFTWIGDTDCWPDFSIEVDRESNSVIVYAEEAGNIEQAANFIQEFLRKFSKPENEPVIFAWSNSCNRAIPGSFGGGAVAIGPSRMFWLSSPEMYVEEAYRNGGGN